MDASSTVDEPVEMRWLDNGVGLLSGLGAVEAASSEYQVDMQRLLDRFADHAAAGSIGEAGGLPNDVLRVWEHLLAAGDFTGADRLVVLARAIRAVDTRHGIAMIG